MVFVTLKLQRINFLEALWKLFNQPQRSIVRHLNFVPARWAGNDTMNGFLREDRMTEALKSLTRGCSNKFDNCTVLPKEQQEKRRQITIYNAT